MNNLAASYLAAGRARPEALPLLEKYSASNPKDTRPPLNDVAALQAWLGQEEEFAAIRRRILASPRGPTTWSWPSASRR